MAEIVQLSRELLEDASGVDQEVKRIFAEIFALKLDLAALYGSGVAPEPRGVKNTTGITTISLGAHGLALTNYDPLIDAVGTLADNNFAPTGFIYPPRTARALAKLKDTTLQPLMTPEYVRDIPRYVTNQVPINLTQGTSNLSSDLFTADWSELIVGIRTSFEIQVLKERYADTGSVGLLCWFRGDIAAARPKAFVVTTGGALMLYCDPHGRIDCEDCDFVKAQERGVIPTRPDLHSRGPGRAPALGTDTHAEPLIADKDTLIPDEDSDIDRHTLVAKGTTVPRELRDRMPKRAAKPAR